MQRPHPGEGNTSRIPGIFNAFVEGSQTFFSTKGPFDLASFKLPRCQDPTENGSFLGAILCPACLGAAEKIYSSLDRQWKFTYEDIDNDIGFLLPENPFQDGSQWICQRFGHSCPSKNAEDICSRLLGRARETLVNHKYRNLILTFMVWMCDF